MGNSHFVKNQFVEIYKRRLKNKWLNFLTKVSVVFLPMDPKACGKAPQVLMDKRTD
jgi:hypothetical protein